MKNKSVSLTVKLNILITAIVNIVSVVLISISYSSYTRTAYLPAHKNLENVAKQMEDYAPSWMSDAATAYLLTSYDGFEEAHKAAMEDRWSNEMGEWLSQYKVGNSAAEIMTVEEYDALRTRMEEEAAEAGVAEDEVTGWIYEHEPRLSSYYFTARDHYQSLGSIIDMCVNIGIYRIQIYAEDTDGYVKIMECVNVYSESYKIDDDSITPWTFASYGVHSKQVEAIEKSRRLKGTEDFRLDTEKGPELVRVMEKAEENSGVRLYAVCSCDITEVVEGQKAFLIRNLVLAGLMEIAAVAACLLILRRIATRPLKQLTQAATSFAAGDEGYKKEDIVDLDIKSNDEIGALYREIRSMQSRIIDNTEHIARMSAEKERISTELELATQIQADMLPNIFPAFPDRTEFDIYASMTPAKAVGGDFYDFFLIDDDHLALVIADVSGKGIPAALFMMISKIMIQNIAQSVSSPAKVLEEVNHQIMANNREEMFVTVWLGVLDLPSGRLIAANAAHEYPMLMAPGGSFQLYRDPHGFVIGGMPGIKYKDYELVLSPGTKLFVYTDGVPEARNADHEFYGTDRILTVLNTWKDAAPQEILEHLREDVDTFAGESEQFDDITMLCLEYRGK